MIPVVNASITAVVAAGLKMASVEATSSTKSSETVSLGENPNQPVLPSYPRRKFGLKSPVFRAFQSSWYKRWPWIHYDQANDCVFCFTCLKAKRLGMLKACASKGEEAFLSRGYTNWKDVSGKHGGFSKHENSQVHRHNIEITSKSMGDVGELLLSEIKKEKEKNCAYLQKVLQNVIFLARQGLSFRGTWVVLESGQEVSGAEVNSRRDALFKKLKEELSPHVPGLRTLCPTRWTVRGNSLESIRRKELYYIVCSVGRAIDIVKLSDVKARINGVAAKMKEFRFLFCLILAERLLKHSDNLSKSMQATYMPCMWLAYFC